MSDGTVVVEVSSDRSLWNQTTHEIQFYLTGISIHRAVHSHDRVRADER